MNKLLHIIVVLLLITVASCRSEEERMTDEAVQTVHAWLEWKYRPLGDIVYTEESAYAFDRKNGFWDATYSAKISCVSRPYGDKVESVDESVFFSLSYDPSLGRFTITNQTLIPNNE